MNDSNEILKEEGSSMIRNIAETIIDSTLTDGPLKDIPGIDMAFSSIKMIKSISDKILFQKLLEFIKVKS